MMQRFLSIAALVLFLAWPVTAEAPALRLTVILTPERAKAAKLESLAPVLTVGPRGAIVVGGPDNLLRLDSRRFLFETPTPVSDCAFTPDGALLMISGRALGYAAGGQFHPQVSLPENAMRLAIGPERIYLYGGDHDQAASRYVVEPQRGHAKLCVLPHRIGAADTLGDTLYLAAANDLYRLVPGGEINLICHLPGPPITSVAAADKDTLYFIAGRTLYLWQSGRVAVVSEGLGDLARWHDGALYVLHVEKQSLVKLENLPALGGPLQETP